MIRLVRRLFGRCPSSRFLPMDGGLGSRVFCQRGRHDGAHAWHTRLWE